MVNKETDKWVNEQQKKTKRGAVSQRVCGRAKCCERKEKDRLAKLSKTTDRLKSRGRDKECGSGLRRSTVVVFAECRKWFAAG